MRVMPSGDIRRSQWVRTWNMRKSGTNTEVLRGAGKRGSRFDRFLRFYYRDEPALRMFNMNKVEP